MSPGGSAQGRECSKACPPSSVQLTRASLQPSLNLHLYLTEVTGLPGSSTNQDVALHAKQPP